MTTTQKTELKLWIGVRIKTQDSHATYERHSDAFSRNHWCRGKAISITYSECVAVSLVIQYAKCMRHIILPHVTCPAVPYFVHIISYTS